MKNIFNVILNFFKILFNKKSIINNDTIINDDMNNKPIDGYDNEPINETTLEQSESESGLTKECNIVILIDNGHGYDTPGKKSPYTLFGIKPEIEFYEYKWNREIAEDIQKKLENLGYDARILVPESNDVPLKERVKRVNKMCSQLGKSNVLLISIHSNASGNGKEWKNAKGWSAYTTKGETKSDILAEYIYDEAKKNFKDKKIRIEKTDGDSDFEENFYILYNTFCPAVLTENFFYDNVDDVKFILSEEGRELVIMTHVNGIINYLKSLQKTID